MTWTKRDSYRFHLFVAFLRKESPSPPRVPASIYSAARRGRTRFDLEDPIPIDQARELEMFDGVKKSMAVGGFARHKGSNSIRFSSLRLFAGKLWLI